MFKEAWYHDFAPPIHSLDRHGDFAPPLTKFNEEAGFIEGLNNPDGCAIRYNIPNGVPPRCHGWLYAKMDTPTTSANSPVATWDWGLYLDVASDFRLLVEGDWDVDNIGGDWNVQVGNDINFAPANDYNIVALNDVNNIAGRNVGLLSGYQQLQASSIEIRAQQPTTFGGQILVTDEIKLNPQTGATVQLNDAQTFVVNDHLGNPLVTYTG